MVARCHLLGGSFAIFIQISLGVLCVGTLIVKRHYEHPRRDWTVWLLDITKQGFGSLVGHFANIYLSQVIAYTIHDADECQWYAFTYIVDCTVGISMNFLLLRIVERLVDRYPIACRMLRFGDYSDPPQLRYFFAQLLAWVGIVVAVKVVILSLMLNLLLPINGFIAELFTALEGHADMELVMVMIIIPTVLNTVAFWVTDTFLKKQLISFDHFTHSHMPLRATEIDISEDLLGEDVESTGKASPRTAKSRSWVPSHPEFLRWFFKNSGLQALWGAVFTRSHGGTASKSYHASASTYTTVTPTSARRSSSPHSHTTQSSVEMLVQRGGGDKIRESPSFSASSVHSASHEDF